MLEAVRPVGGLIPMPRLLDPIDKPPAGTPALRPLQRDQVQPPKVATGPHLDLVSFNRQLDNETHSTVTHGNSVQVYVDGTTAFPEMYRQIATAEKSVHLETFIFHDDTTGWEMAHALAAKADQGVAVRVSICEEGDPKTALVSNIYSYMQEHGVQVVHPHAETLTDPSGIDHRKVLIVDGKRAMIGGMNIGDEYHYTGAKDFHDVQVKVAGPVVADLQKNFLDDWHASGGKDVPADDSVFPPAAATPPGNADMRVLTTYPSDELRKALFTAIDSAKSNINIEAAYFTDDGLVDKLIAAAKRGVQVNLILPGQSDNAAVDSAAQYHFKAMVAAGINLHMYEGRWMHTKAASVDHQWAMVGSCNFDNRSFDLDWEQDVILSDPQSVAKLDQALLEKDLKATPLNTNPHQSTVQKAKTWLARRINSLW